MRFGMETCRSRTRYVQSAARYLEQSIAPSAVEMVVMRLAFAFVKRAKLGVNDASRHAPIREGAQIAIDRRAVEAGDEVPTAFEHILDGKRLLRFV